MCVDSKVTPLRPTCGWSNTLDCIWTARGLNSQSVFTRICECRRFHKESRELVGTHLSCHHHGIHIRNGYIVYSIYERPQASTRLQAIFYAGTHPQKPPTHITHDTHRETSAKTYSLNSTPHTLTRVRNAIRRSSDDGGVLWQRNRVVHGARFASGPTAIKAEFMVVLWPSSSTSSAAMPPLCERYFPQPLYLMFGCRFRW